MHNILLLLNLIPGGLNNSKEYKNNCIHIRVDIQHLKTLLYLLVDATSNIFKVHLELTCWLENRNPMDEL